jgi:hypothetical protein
LYDTNEEDPNNDGEDYTSDNYCEDVVDYVLDAGRCSEEFIKELEAIIANHKAFMKEFEVYIANRKARETV